MKTKFATLLFAVMLGVSATAQKISEDKIPAAVMGRFNTRFPNAEKILWEIGDKKQYEANFRWKGIEQSSTFDENGKWMETGIEIKLSQLPMEVNQTLSQQFTGWKIGEVCKLESARYGLCFEVEADRDKEKLELIISKKGEILSRENSTEDEDKD